jgi:hypothetical protein
MSVSAVQQARQRSATQSSLPPRTTLRSADGFDLTLGGDLLAWVIPSDQRAYLELDGGTDSFAQRYFLCQPLGRVVLGTY